MGISVAASFNDKVNFESLEKGNEANGRVDV